MRTLTIALAAAIASLAPHADRSSHADRAAAPWPGRHGSPFAYDRRAPLDLRDSLERVDGGVEVHRVSFASPRGGRATGFLTRPAGATSRLPAVILQHGAPGSAAGQVGRAERISRLGAVVIALDAPFARRDPAQPISFTARDSAELVQLIVDLQRAVDVLEARPDVDPRRLGYVGGSFGGAYGATLAGVERRLKAYALATADGGLGSHFTDAKGAPLPAPEGMTPEAWRAWLASTEATSSLRYVGRAAPARLLFQFGQQDDVVLPEHARAVYEAASAPKEMRWYDSGHALPGVAKDDAIDWMAAQLGFRTLTAAERAERVAERE